MRNKCKTKNNIKTGQGGHFNNYDGLFNANSPLISESFSLCDKKLSEESLTLNRTSKIRCNSWFRLTLILINFIIWLIYKQFNKRRNRGSVKQIRIKLINMMIMKELFYFRVNGSKFHTPMFK